MQHIEETRLVLTDVAPDVVMVRTQAMEDDPNSVLKCIIYLSLTPHYPSDLICLPLERYV